MKRLAVLLGIFGYLIAWACVGTVFSFLAHGNDELHVLFLFTFLAFIIGPAVLYFVWYARSMNKLNLPTEHLDDTEVVWAKTPQSVVHYESGTPFKFWEAVGGRLFLTNHVLEFRSNPAEFFEYRVAIPLNEILLAEPCRLFGLIPGALRIWRNDGTTQLFTFGAAFDLSKEWADAIMAFREDLKKEEDAERV